MKIDGAAVERMQPAERTALRQGSQQADATGQNRQVVDKQKNEAKDNLKNQIKTQERDRAKNGESSLKELEEAIDQANKSFRTMNRRFEYAVHDELRRVSVKVIDSSNDQVIREIPPEKLLDMVADMLEIAGIIVDERA